jgi:hypothetical protein
VARHIFQACPVWIYTQSNITQASYLPEYITPTQQISSLSNLLLVILQKEKIATKIAAKIWPFRGLHRNRRAEASIPAMQRT